MGLFRRKPRTVGYVLADLETPRPEDPQSPTPPDRALRDDLRPGDLVHLVFTLVNGTHRMPPAEHLPVIVTDRCCGHYVGRLDTHPRHLTSVGPGDRVDFGPEHVLSIGEVVERGA